MSDGEASDVSQVSQCHFGKMPHGMVVMFGVRGNEDQRLADRVLTGRATVVGHCRANSNLQYCCFTLSLKLIDNRYITMHDT